jgi:MFS family permease
VSHFLSGFQFLSFDAGIGETGERFMFSESTGVHRLLIAKGLRAFGDGYVSLLLPLYLVELGLRPFQVGIIATITLIGSGLLTLAVGLHAWRFHYRSLLLVASALMAGTGFGFFVFTSFWPLMVVALVGTLNPSNGDVSVFLPLEHSVLAKLIGDRQRTAVFARYSLMGALLGATGSLASALPPAIAGVTGMVSANVIRLMFIFYALIAGAAGLIYRGLPKTLSAAAPQQKAPLHESKRMVYTLAALFSLDAFGGGFVVQSMLALWLHQRFDTSMATAGVVFFWMGVLTAASYLVAVRIAGRFGLLNTMVFTHIPSSVCLILLPFAPSLGYAIVLLSLRSALSQMDVPTRTSYVMAIVTPEERPAAASITSVPRSLAAAISPFLSGYLLGMSTFGWPLIVGGGVKVAYDMLLLAKFRKIRPPEEKN